MPACCSLSTSVAAVHASSGAISPRTRAGNRVLRYGMARELVLGIEAVLADGTVITSLNKMLKNNAAYDVKQLFIGSEGTLGVITRAVLRLFPKPVTTSTALRAFTEFNHIYDFLRRARAHLGGTLSAFETMWQAFYVRAVEGRTQPLATDAVAYVLIESMGTDPARDGEHFSALIEKALEGTGWLPMRSSRSR